MGKRAGTSRGRRSGVLASAWPKVEAGPRPLSLAHGCQRALSFMLLTRKSGKVVVAVADNLRIKSTIGRHAVVKSYPKRFPLGRHRARRAAPSGALKQGGRRSLRPSCLSTLGSALEILKHFYVFADASGGQFRDVHSFTALWTGLEETLLDLEKLAVAVELTLDVFFVERVTGFGRLQLLDHRRVLLIRGSSPALRGGGPGRLEHRAQHLSKPLLFIRLEFRELLHLRV